MCSGYGALNVVLQHHFVDIAVERLMQTVTDLRQTMGLLQLHLLDVTTRHAQVWHVIRRYKAQLRESLASYRARQLRIPLDAHIENILDEWDGHV
jgi:hypothetical protein